MERLRVLGVARVGVEGRESGGLPAVVAGADVLDVGEAVGLFAAVEEVG